MLVAARIGTMARRGAPLPYDSEVEWIGTTLQDQYINSEVYVDNTNFEVEGEFYIDTYHDYDTFFGVYGVNYAQNGSAVGFMIRLAGNVSTIQGFAQDINSVMKHGSKSVSKGWHNLKATNSAFFIDDFMFYSYSGLSPYQFVKGGGCWVSVFGRRDYRISFGSGGGIIDTVVTIAKNTRCRRFVAKTGGVVIREMIPVRTGSIGCLYDSISGQLFRNAGTGAFIIGPDKT